MLIALLALVLIALLVITDVRRAIFRTVLLMIRPASQHFGSSQLSCPVIGVHVPPLARVEGG
jgi:hypothetical protein